jgi:hypothetical protein
VVTPGRVLALVVALCVAAVVAAGFYGRSSPVASGPTPTPTTPPATTRPAAPSAGALPVRVPALPEIPVPEVAQVDRWLGPEDKNPSVLQQVLRDMSFQTVLSARRPAPTTARCPGDRLRLVRGAVNHCTVSYGGQPVSWTVTITDDRGVSAEGRRVYLYTATPDEYAIRAEVIHAGMWRLARAAGATGTEVRCSRLPAVQVLGVGATRGRCQYLDGSGRWNTFRVDVTREGIVSFDPA